MTHEELSIPAILDISGDLLIVVDTEGKILFHSANPIGSFLRNPLKKGEWLKNVVSHDRETLVPIIINQVIESGKPYKSEISYTHTEQGEIYISVTYFPVFDEFKKVTQIYILVRDITPQKIFERKLSTQAKETSSLIEKANAIIFGVDTRGYITDWNEHCAKVTGYSTHEVYTKKFSDLLLAPKEKPSFEEILQRLLGLQWIKNYEVSLLKKEGACITALFSGTPRTTITGDVIGAVFVGQDITELMQYRKSLEQKVEERTRELMEALKKERDVVELKNRFVAIASHEFRSPLSSMQAYSNFIRLHLKTATELEINEKLSELDTKIQYMMHLLDDVLTYGKSDAGKIQLITAPVSPSQFFLKIIEEVKNSTHNTHEIKTTFKNLPDQILADEKLLRNVFINLLTNAIKFSPGKLCIELEARVENNYWIVSVKDTGMGIPHHELNKIFEPFLRGKSTSHIDGTGLGLSIVKKAVELLNGTIHVQSVPGKGSDFTVTIPFQSP